MKRMDRILTLWLTVLTIVALAALAGRYAQPGRAFVQQSLAGQVSNFSGIAVSAPTSVGTATPAALFDSAGVSALLEVRDGGTRVVSVYDGGELNVVGEMDIGGLFRPSFTDLTVSDGDTITPTYTVYALDTSGAVTITLAASADEGQLLILINDDANATVIADTNLRSSDGNAITLAGAYDIVMFVYQDAEWIELAKTANS